ncbi:MAG: hypothetical protein O8C66_07680 [Candidatus Methanoperedens sp.]|nr:hypothetical protein [Candidatus Methanoperedens sp.]MCZ7370375.1 hypothetical protein [Candidatus Methanoperedens sp.]
MEIFFKYDMKKLVFLAITVLFIFVSGCIGFDKNPTPGTPDMSSPTETSSTITQIADVSNSEVGGGTPQTRINQSDLLIDRIAENLTIIYNKKWYALYQEDELDCSRMSTYLWNYIRSNYHVAPKIVASYQRQHAWLALKVSDVGNSSEYRHWNIKGTDYYYLEATIPKLVLDDNQRFIVNDQEYTSAEFYNATVYFFDTPQDANDFHADNSWLGGWNQEFRLKKDDIDKIETLMK